MFVILQKMYSKQARGCFFSFLCYFAIRKMLVQNQKGGPVYSATFRILKHVCLSKCEAGFLMSKLMLKPSDRLLFSLLTINKYYTSKMFLLRRIL